MNFTKRLLIVEDETNLARVVSTEARNNGWDVCRAETGEEGLVFLEERFDVMLLDLTLPGMNGIELYRSILTEENIPEVVILTGNADVNIAVEAMKMGAYDYLQKPFPMERLLLVLDKAAEKHHLKFRNLTYQRMAEKDDRDFEELVFADPSMDQVLDLAERVAPSDSTVVILGETGTGKDVIANYIHRRSGRASGPFISINCASIQESMLENELFGHEKGAFTDAKERKLGFFDIASGGTLFLDEISEMPLGMQAKLLHVIEKNEFYRVGGTRIINSNARILAASNRNLTEFVERGSFRQDLYFRINMISIQVPPLRERPQDILPLAHHFLINTGKVLSPDAISTLEDYNWPGNVRELKHVIERASVISSGDLINPGHLLLRAEGGEPEISDKKISGKLFSLQKLESDYILEVLRLTKWNRSRAAEILNIDPKTLYRKIKSFGLTPEE